MPKGPTAGDPEELQALFRAFLALQKIATPSQRIKAIRRAIIKLIRDQGYEVSADASTGQSSLRSMETSTSE